MWSALSKAFVASVLIGLAIAMGVCLSQGLELGGKSYSRGEGIAPGSANLTGLFDQLSSNGRFHSVSFSTLLRSG